MKESPILMDQESVRGVLDGTKYQTRRLVKHKKCHSVPPGFTLADVSRSAYPDGSGLGWIFNSTPPAPGNAEWVKKMYPGNDGINCPFGNVGDRLWVRETWGKCDGGEIVFMASDDLLPRGFHGWKPSIHMPRWASRLTLEITNVKAELLHDISEEDAKAEGTDSVKDFKRRWEGIHGKGSWKKNLWLWCISFKQIPHEQGKIGRIA